MIKALGILAASLLLSSQAPAVVIIKDSPGGFVDEFMARRLAFEQSGTEVHISGVCMSACAVYTSLSNVCLEPDAYFYFHQGSKYEATDIVMHATNPAIWQYIEHYGYPLPTMESGEFLFLDGSEAIAKGMMRPCA